MWRDYLQKHSTRAWAYRAGRWVFGELTPNELVMFKSLSLRRTSADPVRFPRHPGVYFGGGRPYQCATYFAKCIVCVARKLPLGVFPIRNENGYAVNYLTEPGIYKTYLWREQVEDAEIAGCDVEVIEGFYWRVLTPPTKSPPRLYSRQERTYIYALVNPLIYKAFYVVYTDYPEQRLIQHLHDTRNLWKLERIQQLHAQGHFPLLMILEEVDATVAQEREDWWTAYYQSLGHNLTNYCCQRLKKSSIR